MEVYSTGNLWGNYGSVVADWSVSNGSSAFRLIFIYDFTDDDDRCGGCEASLASNRRIVKDKMVNYFTDCFATRTWRPNYFLFLSAILKCSIYPGYKLADHCLGSFMWLLLFTYDKSNGWESYSSRFASAGRMSMTIYLSQSSDWNIDFLQLWTRIVWSNIDGYRDVASGSDLYNSSDYCGYLAF